MVCWRSLLMLLAGIAVAQADSVSARIDPIDLPGPVPTAIVTPDELVGKADLVCTGIVKATNLLPDVLPEGHRLQRLVKPAMAHIEVLAVFKGDAAKEIEMRYLHLLPKDCYAGNGTPPPRPLQLCQRYCFFLKLEKDQPWYVNVCYGEYDDGRAMEPLRENERNDNPPLFKEEAIALAKHCIAKELPASSHIIASYNGGYPRYWIVEFFSKEPLKYPSFTSDAAVFIDVSDRKAVPHLSWFSKDVPGENNNPDGSYIGKEVIISYFKPYSAGGGEVSRFRGVIEKITPDEIIGQFWKDSEHMTTIHRDGIRSIQRIHGITTGD